MMGDSLNCIREWKVQQTRSPKRGRRFPVDVGEEWGVQWEYGAKVPMHNVINIQYSPIEKGDGEGLLLSSRALGYGFRMGNT